MNWDEISNKRISISDKTSLNKTMFYLRKIARLSASHPLIIKQAQKLSKAKDQLKAVFDFAYNNVLYKPDPLDVQELRFAHRSLREKRGNCTDYAILISALLQNLGIRHKFRVVAFEKDNGFEHIYIIANDGVPLDPVIGHKQDGTDSFSNRPLKGSFHKEIGYLRKKDYRMTKLVALGSTRSAQRRSKSLGKVCLTNCDCKKLCDNMFSGFIGHEFHNDCRKSCDLNKAKKTKWDPRKAPQFINLVSDLHAITTKKSVIGCMDSDALNFNPKADIKATLNNSKLTDRCRYTNSGVNSIDYDKVKALAWLKNKESNKTGDGGGGFQDVPGCTNLLALNYNPLATVSDGSCQFTSPPKQASVSPLLFLGAAAAGLFFMHQENKKNSKR